MVGSDIVNCTTNVGFGMGQLRRDGIAHPVDL